MKTPPGTAVYLGLMFLLGTAIDRDPFHPWVAEKLRALATEDPSGRARALHSESVEYLGRFTRLSDLTGRGRP